MSEKYKVGALIELEGLRGIVLDNPNNDKLIWVKWEHLPDHVSYEETFLDEFAKVIQRKN